MTQKEFSSYLKIPEGTIRNWEQGIRQPADYIVELIKYKLEHENKL